MEQNPEAVAAADVAAVAPLPLAGALPGDRRKSKSRTCIIQ